MDRLVFAFAAILMCHGFAPAAETLVSFKQTNSGQADHLDQDASLPEASVNGSLNNNETSYDIKAEVDLSNPNALRTTTSLSISAAPRDIMFWQTMEANARAVATMVDTARVQGEFAALSGTIEFHWTISGSTTLTLENAMNIGIDSATSLTTLSSTFTGMPGDLLQELHTAPEGADDYDMTFPASTGKIVVPAQWTVGEDLTIIFDLNSRLELLATNKLQHFEQFTADLSADFGNSAVLDGVLIRDESGAFVPGASLVSSDPQSTVIYNSVPEPSSALLLLLCMAGLFSRSYAALRRK